MSVQKNHKLEDLMIESKESQTEIAYQLGVSRQYLFLIRKDPSIMSLAQVEKLAKILKVKFEVIQEIHREVREAKAAEEK